MFRNSEQENKRKGVPNFGTKGKKYEVGSKQRF